LNDERDKGVIVVSHVKLPCDLSHALLSENSDLRSSCVTGLIRYREFNIKDQGHQSRCHNAPITESKSQERVRRVREHCMQSVDRGSNPKLLDHDHQQGAGKVEVT
jgi:hypothetical protein